MDISTGHMVLSYMEDHLKNKQRLEQEWVGLCAYEAEPNSTSNAFKVELYLKITIRIFWKYTYRWKTRRKTGIRTNYPMTTTECC